MGTATLCQWHSSSASFSCSSLWHVSSSSSLRGRVSCRAPQPQVHLSASPLDKTIFQIKNSGVIACLRASRFLFFVLFILFSSFYEPVLKKKKIWSGQGWFLLFSDSQFWTSLKGYLSYAILLKEKIIKLNFINTSWLLQFGGSHFIWLF